MIQQSSSVASGLYPFPVGFPERVNNAIPPVTGPAAHAPMITAIRRRPISEHPRVCLFVQDLALRVLNVLVHWPNQSGERLKENARILNRDWE